MRVSVGSMSFYAIATLKLLILSNIVYAAELSGRSECRYLPGDPGWPSIQSWTELNATVGGRLIAAVPLASICHEPEYSATACANLKESWIYAAPQ